jgi:peptidoglycan/LPS O-acetylase OafA/YrhL
MMTAASRRLPFLDSARGFAAVSVITWHCFTAIIFSLQNSKINSTPFHLFWYGEADVIFFFVHSGFILSYSNSIFENAFSGRSYIKYLIRRIFRIYPLFLSILLVSYVLKTQVYPIPTDTNYISQHFSKFWENKTKITGLLKESLLAVRIPSDAEIRLIPQDWTLTIELLLCPLIPLLNFINKKFKLFFWAIVFLLIKLFHFNTFLFEFAVGVSLYGFRSEIEFLWNKTSGFIKLIFAVVAIILYTCCFSFVNIFDVKCVFLTPAIDRLMIVTGCAMFFIFILNSRPVQNIFNQRIFVNIGKVCYSLYVNHIFLLICFSNIIMSAFHHWINGPDWLIVLLFVLTFQLLTLLVSLATYHGIEKPFNKFGNLLGIRVSEFIGNKFRKSASVIP